MKNFTEIFSEVIDFLFVYPKSTTTLVIFLSIVVVIALYVNKKRDASGRVSFIDMSKTGVTGIRLYETEKGIRKNNWLLPLWIPEAHLLLNIKILLPKGEYEIRAYWKADKYHSFNESLFKKQPADKEKVYSLSHSEKFEVPSEMPLEFRLTASDKNLQIDSPNKASLVMNPDKPSLPLVISEPSFKKFAQNFEKLKKSKVWELSVFDEQILAHLEYEIKGMNRKLDGEVIKNQELRSNLDKVINKLKQIQESAKAAPPKETPEKTTKTS